MKAIETFSTTSCRRHRQPIIVMKRLLVNLMLAIRSISTLSDTMTCPSVSSRDRNCRRFSVLSFMTYFAYRSTKHGLIFELLMYPDRGWWANLLSAIKSSLGSPLLACLPLTLFFILRDALNVLISFQLTNSRRNRSKATRKKCGHGGMIQQS